VKAPLAYSVYRGLQLALLNYSNALRPYLGLAWTIADIHSFPPGRHHKGQFFSMVFTSIQKDMHTSCQALAWTRPISTRKRDGCLAYPR
jgi:hypothetical protein